MLDGVVWNDQAAILCCNYEGTPEDEGKVDGWPWNTEEALNWLASKCVNRTHWRLGPFIDEEGEFYGYQMVQVQDDSGKWVKLADL